MTKNQIINELYTDERMEAILSKITSNHDLKDDLRQELFLILCEKEDEVILDAYENNYLIYYCIRILKNQYHSSNSSFHKTFRKFKATEFDGHEVEQVDYDLILDHEIECILWVIENKLDYVDRELIKMYYKLGEYNRFDGEKRDESCTKTTSSLRKIHSKLSLINLNGEKVSISIQTIANSINRSKMVIKNNVKKCK